MPQKVGLDAGGASVWFQKYGCFGRIFHKAQIF